ncbi:MAG: ankyrin repeat domain-containing protein [Chitinophagaceae bacterium]|nr:MAG: ankyrin repeat domain-containing protein [Chitinophagaceae bacterium]
MARNTLTIKTANRIVMFYKIMIPIIVIFIPISFAESQAEDEFLPFVNGWFKPFLTQNTDSVCVSLLTQVQADFLKKPDRPYMSDNEPLGMFKDDPLWILQPGSYEENAVESAGEKIYLRTFLGHGCGGACESEFIAVSQTPFTNVDNYANGISLNENQITKPVAAYVNGVNFYRHRNGSNYIIASDNQTIAYKLKPNATLEKVCVIANTPNETMYKRNADIHNSITSLIEKINVIMGTEGNTCGSMHTLSRWKKQINDQLKKTIYRPWAVVESPMEKSTYDIDIKNLESWSFQGISQKISFEAYESQLSATTAELSTFYQKNYTLTKKQAENLAHTVLKSAISSGINFDGIEQPTQDQKNLLTAIIEKKSLATIKQLSENQVALFKNILNISIKNPNALEYFLSKNNTPNEKNDFHKSLLMYAAQYDQLNSAKVLLKHNADINTSTIIPEDDCRYRLSKSGMTALHYAVRYASYDFVKLLLENGAYPYAKTSEEVGAYPVDWLRRYTDSAAQEKNPNITNQQALELESLLKLPAELERKKIVHNYNLSAEKEFSKGNLASAHSNSKKALGLDPYNERTLANLSIISLKLGNYLEALEASATITTSGKDSNQIANAWFNYGLTCEINNIRYKMYNGKKYCDHYPLHYFLESYKIKPTSARAAKIVSTIKEASTPSCQFENGSINLMPTLSIYGTKNNLFVLTRKNKDIDTSKIIWHHHKEIQNSDNTVTKLKTLKAPDKLLKLYDLGDFNLTDYSSDEKIYTPIQYNGEVCNSQMHGTYTISPSTEK